VGVAPGLADGVAMVQEEIKIYRRLETVNWSGNGYHKEIEARNKD
jgi:hypothetical protein